MQNPNFSGIKTADTLSELFDNDSFSVDSFFRTKIMILKFIFSYKLIKIINAPNYLGSF